MMGIATYRVPALHGYTMRDMEDMARKAVHMAHTRYAYTKYDVALSAVGLALAESGIRPDRDHVVNMAITAIDREVDQERHLYGIMYRGGEIYTPPRYAQFWWHGTVSFEEHLVERLSISVIMDTLTKIEREAVIALAVTGDYNQAATMLGIKLPAFQARLNTARERFQRRWYHPETPPPRRGKDKRIGSVKNPPPTHCSHGHEYTPENTRILTNRNGRRCRTCERILESKRNRRRE